MFRFEIPVTGGPHTLVLPSATLYAPASNVSSTGYHRVIEFWAEHRDEWEPVTLKLDVYGTGQHVPDDAVYLHTCPRDPGGYVWHLFEVK
jgi:hypothetical protein